MRHRSFYPLRCALAARRVIALAGCGSTSRKKRPTSDAIGRMRHERVLHLRLDIARAAIGHPAYAWYFVDVSVRTLHAVRHRLTAIPEIRLTAISASRHNLIMVVWLPSLADVSRFEIALAAVMPDARITDRSIVLSIRKQVWHLLGDDTHALPRE